MSRACACLTLSDDLAALAETKHEQKGASEVSKIGHARGGGPREGVARAIGIHAGARDLALVVQVNRSLARDVDWADVDHLARRRPEEPMLQLVVDADDFTAVVHAPRRAGGAPQRAQIDHSGGGRP